MFPAGAASGGRLAPASLARALACCAALALLACASDAPRPHPDLTRVWRDYLALPGERALAIAGHPERDRWVTGASGGHPTREQAEAEALAQCLQRRGMRRMQAPCVLYAVGDEIVWGGRSR